MNENLAQFIKAWAIKTFGTRETRGPEGPLKHMKKEIDEVLADPNDLMEYADLMFLLLDAVYRAGYTYEDLQKACEIKLQINKNRKWTEPNAEGVIEHVRAN